MKLLLTAPPDQCRGRLRFGLPVARGLPGGGRPHLFRASIPVSVRGGLMVIDNTGFDSHGEAGPLLPEVCGSAWRGMTAFSAILRAILQVLAPGGAHAGRADQKTGLAPLRDRAYPPFSDSAIALIPLRPCPAAPPSSAFQEAVERFWRGPGGPGGGAWRRDFFLPSPTGRDAPHPGGAAPAAGGTGPSVFFLQRAVRPLLTYMSRQNRAHFVLFDDAAPSARSSRWPAILASPAPCWLSLGG